MVTTSRAYARSAVSIALVAVVAIACAAPTPSPMPQPTPNPTVAVVAPPASPSVSPAPVVVCEPATRPTTLACDKAVAAANAVVASDLNVISIEFHFGNLPCPPTARCAAPPPNRGYVVFHVAAPGDDLIIGVSADEAGVVTAGDPRSFATPPAG
jgi:hypothetical protein